MQRLISPRPVAVVLLGLVLVFVSVTYLTAAFSTVVSNVNPGWSNSRQNLVFYNGSRFFLLYSKGDNNIYYQSSTDNVTWSGESTLITGATNVFNMFLVNDGKFDLVYLGSPNTVYVRTCTISGGTITPGSASALETNLAESAVGVARTGGGGGDRIYVAAQFNSDFLRIYSANQTGDAQGVTTWTKHLDTPESATNPTIVPYQGTDKALVVYTRDPGGTNSDGIYSRTVTPGGGATGRLEIGNFNSLPEPSSPVRILDTDFRIVVHPPGGSLEEWQWNDTSWTQVVIFDSIETDQASPSLFYDRISGDMYAFQVDTGTDDVERHYKPNGGSWQTEVVADAGEGTTHTIPITQMTEPPYGSSRTVPRELVWGYRVANGANFDLKVGNLNLAVPTTAAITGTTPASLTESNLNGATVTVTITNGTYDSPLVTSDFTLNGAPTGTTISGVVRDSATQATLTLAFDGTDFDVNASMSVTVTLAALASGTAATTGTVTVTAVIEGDFGFRNSITIDRTKVPSGCGTTLASYPMLYSVTDLDLRTTANGGDVIDAQGDDILFRALDDATCGGAGTAPCTLDHEIESYNATTGQLVAWVRIPALNTAAASSNTVIYIYYGNPAITSSIQNADGVWDANYVGVWHLKEEAVGTGTVDLYTDSSGTGNHGDDFVSATGQGGKIGNGHDFDGVDDYINAGAPASLANLGPLTVEAWISPDTMGETNAGKIVAKQSGVPGRWIFELDDTLPEDNAFEFAKGYDTQDVDRASANNAVTLGAWQHAVATWDGAAASTGVRIYANGAETSYGFSQNGSVNPVSDATLDLLIGNNTSAATQSFDGLIDEVRISNIVRSVCWIGAEFNNTNAPGDVGTPNFYTVGDEVLAGVVTPSPAKVGSFVKISTVTTQTIAHGLGEVPKAILLWTEGKTNETFSGSYLYGLGMSDGTTSYSVAMASLDAAGTSDASRRMANKALTIVQWGEVTVAEADLQSWDATNFTLNWTSNTASTGYVVHFLAIGGADVSAKVKNWQMPIPTGNFPVSGIGFQPDVVIHAHIGSGFGTAPPASSASAGLGLGVMDADGDQWATTVFASDAVIGSSTTKRAQQTDANILGLNTGTGFTKKASFVSMDADGFTVNFTIANNSTNSQVISLALKGVNAMAGNFLKSTGGAPVSQATTGVGFKPSAVLLSSIQDVTQAGMVAHNRFGIGASDGTTQGSSALADQDVVTPTNVDAIDKTSKVFVKDDNTTSTINAEASLTSLDNDGFTLNWTTNDAVQTEILYLALGPHDHTEVRLLSFDATRYDRGVLLQWKTGYEVDNLGFHVYREISGVRTRVNRALIAGSGLAAGQGTAVTAEQRYALWDLAPAAGDGSVVYWLEDLDFNGKGTWHGPVTPVAGSLIAPDVPVSTALHDLGKRGRGRKIFVTHGEKGTKPGRVTGVALPQAPIDVQAALTGHDAVKIGIRAPGWYRVTQPELVAAGLSPQVDPRTLQLFVGGVEQAIRVTGETDGRLDASDAIEFFGTGIDTPYTDTRVYWLAASQQRGQRVEVMGSAVTSAVPAALRPASFSATLQQKERSIYFAALRNGDTENWFGSLVSEEATDLALTVLHPDRAAPGPAQLEVALQGVTNAPDVDPDHRVGVQVNGADVGELDFDGQNRGVQTFSVPHAVLRDGENTITLIARGGEADYSLFDVLRLSYEHSYRADADQVRVTVDVPGPTTIGGFTSNAIRVVDITDPAAAVELQGAVRTEGGGFSSITVRVPGPGPRTLLAFTQATIASPAFVRANRPSRWRDATQAHDYVVITHRTFADQATWLSTLRAARGYHPVVVDIEDVYDEFNFGEKTPQALKDFLRWARASWREPPKFVVLMGDATIDPRDYAGMGDADFVPTKQVPMARVALETASDDWFVDFDDDGLPDLAVGRLPLRTADQADTMVSKIERYEQASAQPWTKEVLLVADQNEGTANFEEYSARLVGHLPADYRAQTLFRGSLEAETARQLLALRVNDGQLIVNYQGHGSVHIWGRDGALLTPDDVTTSWRNATRLPLVVTMNCLNGFFHGIWDEESLAETLLRAPGGGAAAVWASSSVTASATQALVNEELFRLIFQGTYATVGEAAAAAKRVVANRDLRRSWIFFGDPALRLIGAPLPASRRTESAPTTSASVTTAAVAGSDQGDAAGDAAATSGPPAAAPVRLVDFNGDARGDLWVYAAESGLWAATLSSADGVTSRIGQWTPGWQIEPAELNGDRRADLVFYHPLTGDVIQSTNTGEGTFSVSRTFASGALGGQLRTGDFNGDRLDDVLIYQPASGAWVVALVDHRGTLVLRRGVWTAGARVKVADFTGDGLADVFGYDPATGLGFVSANQGDAQFVVTSSDWGRESQVVVANLDGDANADLLFYNPTSGAWQEGFTTGGGRFTTRTGTWAAGLAVHATDLDGDGRDDVFAYDARTGRWVIAVNLAPGRFATQSGFWTPGWTVATGDLNGDRLGDLVLYDPVTGIWFRLVTLEPGVFAESSGTSLHDGTLIGRPR